MAEIRVFPDPPADWMGSLPEWAVYWALLQIGLIPNVDFFYQQPELGGRQQLGGQVLDFYLPDYRLAISVQSTYWHYRSTPLRTQTEFARAVTEGRGITTIFIDEADALRNPIYYTREALNLRDHSKPGGF